MIKRILYIFMPVLAVLLMSHNAGAVSLTYNLNDYELINILNYPSNQCAYSIDTWTSSSCTLNSSNGLSSFGIRFPSTLSYEKGDLIHFYLFGSSNNYTTLGFINNGFSLSTYNDFLPLSINEISDDSVSLGNSGESIDCSRYSSGSTGYICTTSRSWEAGRFFSNIYEVIGVMRSSGSKNIGLSSPSTGFPLFTCGSGLDSDSCRLRAFFLKQYRKSVTASNKEQEAATQDAANNSATSGNTSQNNAQNATSSLLSVITSGIGAITSASPTNCKINGNMGNLNVGNIDLCANPVPTFMALIGSIIAVLVVLPLVILLFNRFISIIRSFQK